MDNGQGNAIRVKVADEAANKKKAKLSKKDLFKDLNYSYRGGHEHCQN